MPADEDDPENWFDRPAVIFAAGAAAVVLLVVLIFAVMRTADDSSDPVRCRRADALEQHTVGDVDAFDDDHDELPPHPVRRPASRSCRLRRPPSTDDEGLRSTPSEAETATDSGTVDDDRQPVVTATPPVAGHV